MDDHRGSVASQATRLGPTVSSLAIPRRRDVSLHVALADRDQGVGHPLIEGRPIAAGDGSLVQRGNS